MTWLDLAVLGVMVLSMAWGLWRGLVHEVISLAAWVIAFLVANMLAAPLAELVPSASPRPDWHVFVAFVAVFLVTLTATTLVGVMLSRLAKKAGLGSLDRTLGGVFGLVRGWVIVLAFALLAGLTNLPSAPVWRDSFIGPSLVRAATYLKGWLPAAFADRLRYH
ncbi:MAG TPA: CvpA family protein [Burkholderiales bacterium]